MKILHILVDDKFIDMAIREFEAVAPGVHEFAMVEADEPYRYVRTGQIRNLTDSEFVHEVQRCEIRGVIFHSLPERRYKLLSSIPAEKKVFWFGWGFDYYDRLLTSAYPGGLLMSATAAAIRQSKPKKLNKLVRIAKSAVERGLRLAKLYPAHPDVKALARVDYFSPVIDTEFHAAIDSNSWFSPKYICWNYGTVEDDLTISARDEMSLGDNFLVGNSATPTNNHYEIFDSIRGRIDLSHRKVIVPLSYGDPAYRDKILRLGRTMLGDAFTPLVDFMPPDQYIKILSSCGFVLMNHLRQQALGNICISTLMGAKVFLHPRNPLYAWMISQGVVVGDIERLDTVPLTVAEQHANCQAIRAYWGREAQRKKTRRVVEIALT